VSENLKQRMLQAKVAIKAKQYDKARKLLKGVDHPKAREWLAKLDKVAPKSKRKISLIQYVIFCVIFGCALLTLLILLMPPTPEIIPAGVSDVLPDDRLLPTATAFPLTDPLARHIFASVAGIERIEGVNSLAIPGRDEIQYDFTLRLHNDTNLNETLEAVSDTTSVYQTESNMLSAITFNVLVIHETRAENWRYNGSEWFRRAIDGAAVTATPYPTQDPNAVAPVYVPPQNQSNAPAPSSYTCNCRKTCDQIRTCAEAQYQLRTCGCAERDGDGDGTACDIKCQ
jgi:hypothetical protein